MGYQQWWTGVLLIRADGGNFAFATASPDFLPDTVYAYEFIAENSVIGNAGGAGTTQVQFGISPDPTTPLTVGGIQARTPWLIADYVYPDEYISGTFTTPDAAHYGGPTQYVVGTCNDVLHNGGPGGDWARLTFIITPAGYVGTCA